MSLITKADFQETDQLHQQSQLSDFLNTREYFTGRYTEQKEEAFVLL